MLLRSLFANCLALFALPEVAARTSHRLVLVVSFSGRPVRPFAGTLVALARILLTVERRRPAGLRSGAKNGQR